MKPRSYRTLSCAAAVICTAGALAQPPCPGIRPAFSWVSTDSAVVFEDRTYYPVALPDSVNWDFGDGTYATASTVYSHVYATAGTHSVRMMTWIAGCYFETDALVAHGDWNDQCTELLQPEFFSDQPANNVLNVNDGSSSSISLSHAWMFGDGPAPEFGQAATHTYVLPGPYVVTHTIAGTDSTTMDGCVAGIAKTIFVDGNASTCDSLLFVDFETAGLSDAFQATATIVDMSSVPMAISYWWDYGDQTGLVYGISTSSYSYAYNGDYQVCLHVAAYDGGGTDSCTALVCHTFMPATLGIFGDHAEETALHVYPMPCADRLTIADDGSAGAVALSLFDPQGRLVHSATSAAGLPLAIDVGHLAPGSYLLRSDRAGVVRLARVVKQ